MRHHFRSPDNAEFRCNQRIRLFGLAANRRTRSQRSNLPYARASGIVERTWSLHPSAQPLMVICLSFELQHQPVNPGEQLQCFWICQAGTLFHHLRAVATTHIAPSKHLSGAPKCTNKMLYLLCTQRQIS